MSITVGIGSGVANAKGAFAQYNVAFTAASNTAQVVTPTVGMSAFSFVNTHSQSVLLSVTLTDVNGVDTVTKAVVDPGVPASASWNGAFVKSLSFEVCDSPTVTGLVDGTATLGAPKLAADVVAGALKVWLVEQ